MLVLLCLHIWSGTPPAERFWWRWTSWMTTPGSTRSSQRTSQHRSSQSWCAISRSWKPNGKRYVHGNWEIFLKTTTKIFQWYYFKCANLTKIKIWLEEHHFIGEGWRCFWFGTASSLYIRINVYSRCFSAFFVIGKTKSNNLLFSQSGRIGILRSCRRQILYLGYSFFLFLFICSWTVDKYSVGM